MAATGPENYALQRSFAMASAKIADARNKKKAGKATDKDMAEFKREVQMVRCPFAPPPLPSLPLTSAFLS